jgi:xanthine dehydrogenase YagR molybdenum-binding subunit
MTWRVLGKSAPRLKGREKATGAARYPGDFAPGGLLHGRLVTATVGKGEIVRIDTAAAAAVAGVQVVFTHENLGDYTPLDGFYSGGYGQASFWPLRGPEIRYYGQIVAYVVADTLEAAEEAAALVEIDYRSDTPEVALDAVSAAPREVEEMAESVGDVEAAFAAAAHRVEAEYATPIQHHNSLERFCTIAEWTGDALRVDVPSQAVVTTQYALAEQFGLPPETVTVESAFVGGAFGSKASVAAYVSLTALVARKLGRPVKLQVERAQMYTVASFRPETRQRVTLACDAEGRLTGYAHDQISQTSRFEDVLNPGTESAARMYACPNLRMREFVQPADVNSPGFMRAPDETPPFFALESAMDELAHEIGMDPVEFRLKNDTMHDPISGLPFSSRSLAECYRLGAERFGWWDRDPKPGAMRRDGKLVGYGCATACYPTTVTPSAVRVRLNPAGDLAVELAAHDIGTGTYAVVAMVAAEVLGLPLERIAVELGSSRLPPAPIAGGSVTAASTGSAVHAACLELRDTLIAAAVGGNEGALAGIDAAAVRMEEGALVGPEGRRLPLDEVLGRLPAGSLEVRTDWSPPGLPPDKARQLAQGGQPGIGPKTETHVTYAFGAHFVEATVDARTCEIRVPRMLGVFAAGTVLNARAGYSQLSGGMIWGLGSALLEASEVDPQTGRYVNDNLSEYLVATNADSPGLEVEILPERDAVVNPLGAKGIGELGIVGMAGAVANAVYHATGTRVRRLPIRMEDLI